MNNKEILILNDTHFDYGTNYRKYVKYSIEKAFNEQIFPNILERKIQRILHLGDVFERKYNLFMKDLEFVQDLFVSFVEKHNLEVIMVAGNHDLQYDNSLKSCTLDYVFGNHKNFEIIKTFKEIDNKILLTAWINEANREIIFDKINSTKCPILAGHFEFNGFSFSRNGIINQNGLEPDFRFDKFDLIVSGHLHSKSSRRNIVNLGTQHHLNKSDSDEDKFHHIINLDNLELLSFKNEHHLFKRIIFDENNIPKDLSIYKESIVDVFIKQDSFNKKAEVFIKELSDNCFSVNTIIENSLVLQEKEISSKEIVKTEKEKLKEFVELVETDLDKNILFSKMEKYLENSGV